MPELSLRAVEQGKKGGYMTPQLYRLKDTQLLGHYFGGGVIFPTMEAIREQLVSYHSADWGEESETKISSRTLDDLLEYGNWSLEKYPGPPDVRISAYCDECSMDVDGIDEPVNGCYQHEAELGQLREIAAWYFKDVQRVGELETEIFNLRMKIGGLRAENAKLKLQLQQSIELVALKEATEELRR